jgi:hypothetical protein
MSIHMIAAYVPDGSVVRCDAQGELVEGHFHRRACALVVEGRCLSLTATTLLHIVRFPLGRFFVSKRSWSRLDLRRLKQTSALRTGDGGLPSARCPPTPH